MGAAEMGYGMIDLESMTTEEKLERLEHIIEQLNVLIDSPDTDGTMCDCLRSIIEGAEAWSNY